MQDVDLDIKAGDRDQTAAFYVVAMHLEANAKVGNVARLVSFIAVVAAVWVGSVWPLLAGLVIDVAAYFFLINSCVRFVEGKTGIPPDVQAQYSRRYKTDPDFAMQVDTFRLGGAE